MAQHRPEWSEILTKAEWDMEIHEPFSVQMNEKLVARKDK